MGSIIEIKGLTMEYADAAPLKDVDLTVDEGEVISIIGPSGTGKSTLMRCINRLETPTSGTIIVDGTDVTAPGADLSAVRKKMGMVFQQFNLFPHKMAIENIMMPQMALLGKTPKEAYTEAVEQLRRVGLESKARKYPDELSGGQKQRVAIARALAMHPKIMLFDEPTSALDPTMVSEVLSVIRELAGTGLTMLIVTHEMRLARDVSSRVLYIDRGSIYEQGPPEQIFEHPKEELTRRFVFRIHSWEYTLSAENADIYEMMGQLDDFCLHQFMGEKTATNCRLAVEELTVSCLLPKLRKLGRGSATLRLNAGENGGDIILEADYPDLLEGGDPVDNSDNVLSLMILSKVAERQKTDEKGMTRFIIRQK